MVCWYRGLTVGIVVLSAVMAVAPKSGAEPVLERLERAIRRQAGQEETPAVEPVAPAAQPVPAAGQDAAPADAVEGGFLGAVTDDKADRGRGVRILSVRPQGPADKAGVKANDLVVAIAGTRVRQLSDFADLLAVFPPGDVVVLDIQRDGKTSSLKVTLGRRPADAGAAAAKVQDALPEPPILDPVAGDDVATLKRRITKLEQRVADLEQALTDLLNRK